MNQQELTRFETEAAEIVGAMKDLFKEFERHLGEIVSAQRMASTEARAEGARVTKDLHELRTSARTLVGEQRDLLARLEREWQLRIDSNAQRAGEAQAKAFGESVAQGLHGRLAELASQVEASIRRYTWKSSLQWALGIAIAIPLTVAVGISAFSPRADKPSAEGSALSKPDIRRRAVAINLTEAQTREAVSKLSLCQVAKTADWHACIEVDSPPRMGLGSADRPRIVVRGM